MNLAPLCVRPSAVRPELASARTDTDPFSRRIEPIRAGAFPAGSTMRLPGSLPTEFSPSWSQTNPIKDNQPSSRRRLSRRLARH